MKSSPRAYFYTYSDRSLYFFGEGPTLKCQVGNALNQLDQFLEENQNRFLFWYKRENNGCIKQRLEKAKRPDLIEKLLGNSPEKSPSKVPTWLEEKRNKSK